MPNQQPEKSAFEKHWQTFAITLMLGVVGWGSKTLFDMSTQIAVMGEAIAQLKILVAQSYNSTTAQRDIAELSRRIDRNEQRLDRVEQRVNGRAP